MWNYCIKEVVKVKQKVQKFGKFMHNRLKNRYLWIAVIALVANMGLSGYIELPENFEGTASAFLNVLMMLGIFNNPSTQSQNLFVDVDNDGIDDRYDDDISVDEGQVG